MSPSLLTVTQQSELLKFQRMCACVCVCACVCICLIVLGLFIFKYTRDSFLNREKG